MGDERIGTVPLAGESRFGYLVRMEKRFFKRSDKAPNQVASYLDSWWLRITERTQTLRFRLLGIVVLSVLIPSFLGGWYASGQIRKTLETQVQADIAKKAEEAARKVGDKFNRLEQDVQAFASSFLLNEEVRNIQKNLKKEAVQKSLTTVDRYITYLLEDTNYFSGFAIINADGTVLASRLSEGEMIPADALVDMPGNQTVFMELNDGNSSRVMILKRMTFEGGLSSTVFAAIIKGEEIQSTVDALKAPNTALYLVDSEGKIKVSNIEIEPGTSAPQGALPLIGKDIKDKAIYKGLLGEQVIANWVNIEKLPWGVVLETSQKKAMAPLRIFSMKLILMVLVLAGLFLIPALLFARTFIVPLEELSRVSRRIRSGKPGLEVKARAVGELGEFIQTFNSMSISLQESLEEIRAHSEQMRVMTITDPLTGRYNRRYIEDYLPRELELSVRTRQPLTVLMVDLDRFKDYNDTYGHIAGDEALKQLADLMVHNVRKTDVVARFGGEEWIVCLSHTDREGGARIAEKLREGTEKNIFRLKGENTRITISIGLATAPEDGTTFEEIVDAADAAMYIAKEAGRNRVELFTGPVPGGSSPQSRKKSSPGTSPSPSSDQSQNHPGKDTQGPSKTRKKNSSKQHS
jgi:diguanylate cyclase (GGDEF)-like protein